MGCRSTSPFFIRPKRGRPIAIEDTDSSDQSVAIADVGQLSLETGRRIRSRHAGVFLFLPLLAEVRFDQLVKRAGYPESKMVPVVSAMLSLLTMKLLDKERLSHIDDFNCDEALGLFAGLNVLPKKSFATDFIRIARRANSN